MNEHIIGEKRDMTVSRPESSGNGSANRMQSQACLSYAEPMEQRVESQARLGYPESRQRKTKVKVPPAFDKVNGVCRRHIAVILAGGSGRRLGGDCPKQFLQVGGKTVLELSIEAFHRNSRIDEIAVVTRADFIGHVSDIVRRQGYEKVRHVVAGGSERHFSTLAALELYGGAEDCLLIHDAVRPLVSQRIINDCIDALDTADAVDVAVAATDTIIAVDDEGRITDIPPRKTLRNVQTPQAFRAATLREAFRLALADSRFVPTDDCSVVFRYLPQCPIKVVEGDTANIKITYKEDLEKVEAALRHTTEADATTGKDIAQGTKQQQK